MRAEVRRELAARRGECYVALRDPGPELLDALGERARVVRPVGGEGPGRVTLDVPGAVVSGDRAYLENGLVIDGDAVGRGVYGRTSVLEPLTEGLKRLWSTAVPAEEIPPETWRARRAAAVAHARYRFGEKGSGELREAFAAGYDESAPDLSRVERELWSHVVPPELAAFVDGLEPVALRTGIVDLVPGPRGPGVPEAPEGLVEGLCGASSDLLMEGVEIAGGIAPKLVGDSVEEGLVLVVSSLLVDRPKRDALFAAGAATLAQTPR